MNRYFTFVKNTIKLKLFKKFFEHKNKNVPLNKQRNAACPEGRNFI